MAWNRNYAGALQLLLRASVRGTDTVLYNQALVLGRLKRYESAEQLLRTVPNFLHSSVNQGIYRCLQGDAAGGVQMLENAVGRDASGKQAFNRALAYLQLNRPEDASRAIEEAIRQRGNEPVYKLVKGDVLLQRGKDKEALALYRSLEGIPDVARMLPLRIGNALVQQKQYADAVLLFERHLQTGDRMHHYAAHYGLGNAFYGLRDFKRAAIEYRLATQFKPQSALAHVGLGNALCSQRDYKASRQAYETAIQHDPANPYAHLGLGVVAYRQGQFESATEAFEKAGPLFNTKDPSLSDIFLSRALNRMETNQLRPALSDFLIAVQLDNKNPAVYAGISEVYRRNENFLQSLRYIQEAIRLDPRNDHLLTNQGNLFLKVNSMDEAYPLFRYALNHNPHNLNALNGLGVALLEKDQFGPAEALYDSLLARGHQKAFLFNNRGIVRSYIALKLEKEKQLSDARQYYYKAQKDFEKAQKIDSTRKFYQNNLGNVFKNVKDFNSAVRSYQSYLSKTAINNMGVLFASNAKGDVSKHYLNIAIDLDSSNRVFHYNRYKVYSEYYMDSLAIRKDLHRAEGLIATESISAKYSKDGYINIYLYDYDFDKYEYPGDHFFPIRMEAAPLPDYLPLDELVTMVVRPEVGAAPKVSPPVRVVSRRMPRSPRARNLGSTRCPVF